MAHIHPVYDTDQYFAINDESKEIVYQGENLPILTEGDHVSERYTFEIPRYIDGHDMKLCDLVQVHYINISAKNDADRISDVYKVTDLQVDSSDDTLLLFSWLVSGNATQYVGPLNFAIRFACTSGSKIEYAWYTRPYTKIQVVATIDNTETVAEYYSDILMQWYEELVVAGDTGVNIVVDARNKALADIANAKTAADAAIDQATDEAIERINAVETIRELEQESIDNITQAGETAVENVKKAEADAIENEKEELISEIVSRILFSGMVTYPAAEEASF